MTSKDILVLYIILGKLEKNAISEKSFLAWKSMLEERLRRRLKAVAVDGRTYKESIWELRRQVKEIPILSSALYAALEAVEDRNIELYKRRETWRWIRREHPVLFQALVLQRESTQLHR